jgi:hypothetical protein
MVGDDLDADVRGAQALGMTGVLVRADGSVRVWSTVHRSGPRDRRRLRAASLLTSSAEPVSAKIAAHRRRVRAPIGASPRQDTNVRSNRYLVGRSLYLPAVTFHRR